MPEYDICPKCYSHIDKYEGGKSLSRIRGELGEDDLGEPLPFWTDDPLYTPLGLSGDNYKGLNFWRWIHIKELRDYYNELETNFGLEQTEWTDEFETGKKVIPKHIHIEELRIAIERLLGESGLTLSDYFKSDKYGNEHESTQTEWTDVNRDNENSYPLLPQPTIIKAIHIEELRIGLKTVLWKETWTDNNPYLYRTHTMSAPPGNYLEEDFNIDADNNWDVKNILSVGTYPPLADTAYATSTLSLLPPPIGTLSYAGSTSIYSPTGFNPSAHINCRFLLKTPMSILLTQNTKITWTGNFTGSTATTGGTGYYGAKNRVYAALKIYLRVYRELYGGIWPYDFEFTLYKLASGSEDLDSFTKGSGPGAAGPNAYELTNWPPSNPLNIYDLLEAAGHNMDWEYRIRHNCQIYFACSSYSFIGGTNTGVPHSANASLNVSIDNIKIF